MTGVVQPGPAIPAATPAQLQANVSAAQTALASNDLTALQAFQALVQNPATTIGQLTAALQALPGQLATPSMISGANGLQNVWTVFLGNIQTAVTAAQALP